MFNPAIPQKLQVKLSEELKEGEILLWSGRPKPVYFAPGTWDIFKFGINWTTFTLIWMAFGIATDGPLMFWLIGVAFLLAGAGMLSAPLWSHRFLSNTGYMVTNRRAVIVYNGRKTKVQSYRKEQLKNVFRRQYKDGTGDLIIDREAKHDSDSGKYMIDISFDRIADAKRVEGLLRCLESESKAEPDAASSKVLSKANIRLDSNIPPDIQDVIFDELDRDETVAWSAMPKPIYFTKTAKLCYWIGLPAMLFFAICAVILAYVSGSFSDHQIDYNFIVMEGIFMCAIGAILWTPITAYRKTRKIAYVITNRRAILFEMDSGVTIRSFNAKKLRDRNRSDHKNGSSDIIIKFAPWHDPEGDRFNTKLGFFRIRDADHVEKLLESLGKSTEPELVESSL